MNRVLTVLRAEGIEARSVLRSGYRMMKSSVQRTNSLFRRSYFGGRSHAVRTAQAPLMFFLPSGNNRTSPAVCPSAEGA